MQCSYFVPTSTLPRSEAFCLQRRWPALHNFPARWYYASTYP